MKQEIFYTVAIKKGYPVTYIDPQTLEECAWNEGPFKDPCDASEQFKCFAVKGKGTWLTPASFKAQVQTIINERQKLAEWNTCSGAR